VFVLLPAACSAAVTPAPEVLVQRYVAASRGINMRGKVLDVHPSVGSVHTTMRKIVRRSDGKSLSIFEAPASQKGVIVADDGVWISRYEPAQRIVRKKRCLERLPQDGVQRLARLILRNYEVETEGMETVAGRSCYRVRFEPRDRKDHTIRIWVDKATGAELRRDELDHSGSTISISLFTSVAFPTRVTDAEVTPRFPAKVRVITMSRSGVHTDVGSLTRAAGFPIRVPLLTPVGFAFVAGTAADIAGRKSAFLRYTDGLSDMTIIETPVPGRGASRTRVARVTPRPYGETEVDYALDDLQVVLIGRSDAREMIAAAESMDQRIERRWRQDVARAFNGRSEAVGSMRNRGLTGDVVVALLAVSVHSGKPPSTVMASYLDTHSWQDLARRWHVPETVVQRHIHTLRARL